MKKAVSAPEEKEIVSSGSLYILKSLNSIRNCIVVLKWRPSFQSGKNFAVVKGKGGTFMEKLAIFTCARRKRGLLR